MTSYSFLDILNNNTNAKILWRLNTESYIFMPNKNDSLWDILIRFGTINDSKSILKLKDLKIRQQPSIILQPIFYDSDITDQAEMLWKE